MWNMCFIPRTLAGAQVFVALRLLSDTSDRGRTDSPGQVEGVIDESRPVSYRDDLRAETEQPSQHDTDKQEVRQNLLTLQNKSPPDRF